ncbi:hypothetical protein DQY68_17360 [Salmonella enterica subsp. salamae]|nr:hypothetical protein [Salmonella enterica subsp. salamae]
MQLDEWKKYRVLVNPGDTKILTGRISQPDKPVLLVSSVVQFRG